MKKQIFLTLFLFFAITSVTILITKHNTTPEQLAKTLLSEDLRLHENHIQDLQIKTFHKKSKWYSLNKTNPHFIYVKYSKEKKDDCGENCMPSHFCAIIDNEEILPYYFYFSHPSNNILKIKDKITLGTDFTSDNYAKNKMTAQKHKITNTKEFKQFIAPSTIKFPISSFDWCK